MNSNIASGIQGPLQSQVLALEQRLMTAWSQETSADPAAWTTQNPAWGQCAVTALIVQDQFFGDLVAGDVVMPDGRLISHYWSVIEGAVIDLTWSQFANRCERPNGQHKRGVFATTRDRMLSFEATKTRYDRLRGRMGTNASVLPRLAPQKNAQEIKAEDIASVKRRKRPH